MNDFLDEALHHGKMMLMYIIEVEKKNDNIDLDGATKHVEEAIKSLAGIKHLSDVYKEFVKNTINEALFENKKGGTKNDSHN